MFGAILVIARVLVAWFYHVRAVVIVVCRWHGAGSGSDDEVDKQPYENRGNH